jgi:5-methylcytosine-specific restriction endonuclease McrA
MEKKFINLLKKRLREASRYWPEKHKILKNSRQKIQENNAQFKNGQPKFTTKFLCNSCKKLYSALEVEVDHIEEVGSFTGDWNEYIDRLFCPMENLQVLCKECHKIKTERYNRWTRMMRLI